MRAPTGSPPPDHLPVLRCQEVPDTFDDEDDGEDEDDADEDDEDGEDEEEEVWQVA